MTITRRRTLSAVAAAAVALTLLPAAPVAAASAEAIDNRVNVAMGRLYEQVPYARELAQRAKAMLIMPKVVKGSFLVGGAYGEGALRLNNPSSGYSNSVAYYSVAAGSVGFQIGFQKSSHVLFFLTQSALENFRRSDGWEVGADAEVTFPDAGLNAAVNSTTIEKPIIGVVFSEDGLAIGASLEGAKYSRIDR